MDSTEQILVIILSSFLALFLLLAIISIVMVLQLLSKLRKLVSKAEKVVDSAEVVGEVFRKTATPVSFFRFLRGVADMASNKHNHNKE